MIIVTGGAGFIGSNLVHTLNEMGRNDIIVVDDLTDGRKFRNLVGCDILDYVDKEDFLDFIEQSGNFSAHVDVIFHQGACSTTTEWDGRKMMHHNYDYSKVMLHYALQHEIPFIYASSAAVYGDGKKGFREARKTENPLNVYGYSKWQFDQYVRSHVGHPESQVVGLRYFNVYGPREAHKDSMASVCYHFDKQCAESGTIKLFEGSDGFEAGEQLRDFVHVSDVVAVNLWFWQNPEKMGLYNVGTGEARTFNALAEAVKDYHGCGEIEYIPFPETLAGSYQSYTEADISRLREAGYEAQFLSLEQGVRSYLDWLHADDTSNVSTQRT